LGTSRNERKGSRELEKALQKAISENGIAEGNGCIENLLWGSITHIYPRKYWAAPGGSSSGCVSIFENQFLSRGPESLNLGKSFATWKKINRHLEKGDTTRQGHWLDHDPLHLEDE